MVKIVLNFLSSMKFGMLLLILILICSLTGSLIPQGYDASYYAIEYPEFGDVLLFLQLDKVFSSWYFIAIITLLCLNLIFCSIIRLKNTIKKINQGLAVATSAISEPADPIYTEKVAEFFKTQRFKVCSSDDATIYYKNISGYYGSFIVHLSLLFILIFGACAMYFTTMEDVDIMVGESAVLFDGTTITVESFRIKDEYGALDYESVLQITDKHGNKSEPAAVRVNYPFSFGGHKYYQQKYGIAGHITVTNKGVSSPLYMTEGGFITLDGQNGIMYYEVYPDYKKNADGSISVLKDWSKGYSNPIYMIAAIEYGATIDVMALPGTSYQIGEMLCTFHNPILYPGIRVKTNSPVIMGLLYASFALMIVGLWLCLFHIPIYGKIDDNGYALYSPKSTLGIKAQMNSAIRTYERERRK